MFQSIEAGDLGLLPVIEKISTGIEIGCSQGRKAGLSGRGLMMDMHRKPNEYNRAGQMGIFSCFGCWATQGHHSFFILLIAKGFTAYTFHTAYIPPLSRHPGL